MSFNPIDIHVGQRVKIKRKSIKMTQQELGAVLGLTFQQVQKYERGANRISASKLFAIAETLGVSISYFFDDMVGIEDMDAAFAEETADFAPSRTHAVLQFASSLEGIELNKAFTSISDAKIRKQLVALFEVVASTEDH